MGKHSWYAVRVRSRCEKVVAASLESKGYAHFLPLHRRRRAGGRCSKLPRFPGYVFARFNPAARLPVVMIPGVMSIVSNGRELLAIGEDEIAAVRKIEEDIASEQAEPIPACEGPLRSASGIVISAADRFPVIASIILLQR